MLLLSRKKYHMLKRRKWVKNHINYEIFSFLSINLRKRIILNKQFLEFKNNYTNIALREEKISLSLSCNVPLSYAKIINNLRALSLISDKDQVNLIGLFKDLSNYTSLKCLKIYRLKIFNKEISHFTAALFKLTNLTSLCLYFVQINLNNDEIILLFTTITNMKNLTSLIMDFSCHSIHREAIINMAYFISKLTQLINFVLILNQIRHSLYVFDDSHLSELAIAIGKITSLERLEFHATNNFIKNTISISKVFPELLNLKKIHLNLSSNIISKIKLNEITFLSKLCQLTLILSDNNISDITFLTKNLESLKNLNYLSLALDNNNLTNSNKISDQGIKEISDCLVKLESLSKLCLYFNNNFFSKESIKYLVNNLMILKNLSDLTLDFGERSPNDSIKKLLRSKFGSKVSFYNKLI